jgi:hypothetical protein
MNLDGPDTLEFSEVGTIVPTHAIGSRVEMDIAFDSDEDGEIVEADYKLRFLGVILRTPRASSGGLRVDYQAAGPEWIADEVRVTHPQSGKAEVGFNLSPIDPLYEEELARLPIGEILRRVLTYDAHATALWNLGILAYTSQPPLIDPLKPELGRAYNTPAGTPAVLKAATLADLATMTLIPYTEVRFAGVRLWQAVRNVLEDQLPCYAPKLLPDGTIRFLDTREPTWVEMKLGAIPLEPPSISCDGSQTYGAVEIVGDDEVVGRSFETSTTLLPDWTAAEQAAWKITDHTAKTDNDSKGTIPAGGVGATTITVKPTEGALAWAANKWALDRATIELVLPVGPNNPSELVETRRVVGNTACVSGGTATISLEYALADSGYTHYRLYGQSTNPRRWVYRRYKFKDPAIAARIVDQFPYPVNWELRGGSALVQVPVGKMYRADAPGQEPRETDLYFDLFTDSDGVRKVLAREPVVTSWTAPADLEAGGSAVKAPDRVLVFVPVSRGVLKLREPAAGWAGAAASNPYFRRTKYIVMSDWRFKGDSERMRGLAQQQLAVNKDLVQAGTLTYSGLWREGVETPNAAAKVTSTLGTTPWEADKLLVRSVEVTWTEDGATAWMTRANVSNERRPWAGDRQFTPASFVQGGPLGGGR